MFQLALTLEYPHVKLACIDETQTLKCAVSVRKALIEFTLIVLFLRVEYELA